MCDRCVICDRQTPYRRGDRQTPYRRGDRQTPYRRGDRQTPYPSADCISGSATSAFLLLKHSLHLRKQSFCMHFYCSEGSLALFVFQGEPSPPFIRALCPAVGTFSHITKPWLAHHGETLMQEAVLAFPGKRAESATCFNNAETPLNAYHISYHASCATIMI